MQLQCSYLKMYFTVFSLNLEIPIDYFSFASGGDRESILFGKVSKGV